MISKVFSRIFTRKPKQTAIDVPAEPVSQRHESWCDTNMPEASYWASQNMPIECNCDSSNARSNSAYALISAIRNFEQIDREMQQAIFGKEILPPVSKGTAFENKSYKKEQT